MSVRQVTDNGRLKVRHVPIGRAFWFSGRPDELYIKLGNPYLIRWKTKVCVERDLEMEQRDVELMDSLVFLEPVTLNSYKDNHCIYGYMNICSHCIRLNKAPSHVDIAQRIELPPARGKRQECELCKQEYVLQ